MNWTKVGTPIEVDGMQITPEIEIEVSLVGPRDDAAYVWVDVRPVSVHVGSSAGTREIFVPNPSE